MTRTLCDFDYGNRHEKAAGAIIFDDGEEVVGCAECLLLILADPAKPVHEVIDYVREAAHEASPLRGGHHANRQ